MFSVYGDVFLKIWAGKYGGSVAIAHANVKEYLGKRQQKNNIKMGEYVYIPDFRTYFPPALEDYSQ
jgi:hypothetical protein